MIRKTKNLGLVYGGYYFDGGAELLAGRNLQKIKAAVESLATKSPTPVTLTLTLGAYHADGGIESTARKNLEAINAALVALGADSQDLPQPERVDFSGGNPVSVWAALLSLDTAIGALGGGGEGGGEGGGGEGGGGSIPDFSAYRTHVTGEVPGVAIGDWSSGRGVIAISAEVNTDDGLMFHADLMGTGSMNNAEVSNPITYEMLGLREFAMLKPDGSDQLMIQLGIKLANNRAGYIVGGVWFELWADGRLLHQDKLNWDATYLKTVTPNFQIDESMAGSLRLVIYGNAEGGTHIPAMGDWRTGAGYVEFVAERFAIANNVGSYIGVMRATGNNIVKSPVPANGQIGTSALGIFGEFTYREDFGFPPHGRICFSHMQSTSAAVPEMVGRTFSIYVNGTLKHTGVIDGTLDPTGGANEESESVFPAGLFVEGDIVTIKIESP